MVAESGGDDLYASQEERSLDKFDSLAKTLEALVGVSRDTGDHVVNLRPETLLVWSGNEPSKLWSLTSSEKYRRPYQPLQHTTGGL